MNQRHIEIFVSYSHEDSRWFEEGSLMPRLIKSLEREGASVWYDRGALHGGVPWREEIEKAIDRAHIAVLLVSQNFLNSDFIRESELQRMEGRAERKDLVVIPILVGHCEWKSTALLDTPQMVPGKPTPLVNYLESQAQWDAVQYEILKEIKFQIGKLRHPEPSAMPEQLPPELGGQQPSLGLRRARSRRRRAYVVAAAMAAGACVAGLAVLWLRPPAYVAAATVVAGVCVAGLALWLLRAPGPKPAPTSAAKPEGSTLPVRSPVRSPGTEAPAVAKAEPPNGNPFGAASAPSGRVTRKTTARKIACKKK